MKTMCPHIFHHNGFVATHALGHMMYGTTLLVHIKKRVLNKQGKERDISGLKSSTPQRVLKSNRTKMNVIYM